MVSKGGNGWSVSFMLQLQSWSVRKVRDDLLFEESIPKWDELKDMIKLRVAFWVKKKKPAERDIVLDDFIFHFQALRMVL